MATNVEAKLGLVITATDEASQIFQEFAERVLRAMTETAEAMTPVTEAMTGMSETMTGVSEGIVESATSIDDAFKGVSETFTATQEAITDGAQAVKEDLDGIAKSATESAETVDDDEKAVRESIGLTRTLLREWSTEHSELFGDMSMSVGEFADVSTGAMKSVYEATNNAKVVILEDLTGIIDMTDGPAVEAQNKLASTYVMTSNQIRDAIQGVIDSTGNYRNLLPLLTEENSSSWKKIYEQIEGVNVILCKTPPLLKDVVEAAVPLEETFQAVAQNAEAMNVSVASSTKKMAEGFGSMSKASSAMMVGTTLEGIGTHALEAGTNAITMGANFEQSVVGATTALNERLTPATQLTSDNVQDLSDKAMLLGKSGLFSANELADAMGIMAKNGMNYKELMGGAIGAVQDLAGATGSALTDTARTMTDIYNEYGPEVEKFGSTTEEQFNKVADIVTGAMSNSSISMTDFLTSMKYAGPVAGGLGMSLRDVATSISILGKAGVQGGSAGTYLRSMLADLTPTAKPAAEMMQKLGIITKDGANQFINANGTVKSLAEQHDILTATVGKLNPALADQAMKVMFGKRSLNGMEAVLHTSKDALTDLSVVVDKNGSAHEMAAAKMVTTAGSAKILKSNFETLEKQIGIGLLPVIDALIPIGQSVIDLFTNMEPGMRNVIVISGLLGGAFLLLGGKVAMTYAQYQFFKIATADLLKAQEEQTAVTDIQTTSTEAQSVATGELTLATEANTIAEGESLIATEALTVATDLSAVSSEGAAVATEVAEVATRGNIFAVIASTVATSAMTVATSIATGATALFGGALAILTSPIAIVVGAVAILGLGLYELYQHFTPFHEVIDAMGGALKSLATNVKSFFWGKDYTKDITDMSNKSVAGVVDMSNTVLAKLEIFKGSSVGITEETSKAVVAASKSMYDQVVKKADERHAAELADAELLKKDLGKVGEDNYKSMVENADKTKTDTVKSAKEMNDKVNAEIAKMEKDGTKVTAEMKDQIIMDFEAQRDGAVKALSDSQVQQQLVMEKLKHNQGELTAEIAQQTIKDATTAKDEAVKAANAKCDEDIKAIIRERNGVNPISQAQASDMIEQANKAKTGAIDAATDTYTKTLDTVKQQRTDVVKEVNLTTGDMLTGWQKFEKSILSIFSTIGSALSNMFGGSHPALPSMPDNIPGYNAQGSDFYEGGPTWVGEDGPELVDLPQGSKITPHQSSMNRMINMGGAMNSSSSNQTTNITINVNGVGKNGSQVGQDIAKQLRLQVPIIT